jgi:hypothetical protein
LLLGNQFTVAGFCTFPSPLRSGRLSPSATVQVFHAVARLPGSHGYILVSLFNHSKKLIKIFSFD